MADIDKFGALAAALAKAQASFPAIPRDKEVTVTMDKGGSYKFKYAPLDSILTATRKPLSDNGLAVAQLLDSDAEGLPALVTMLLHSGGGSLTARTPIPFAEGAKVQAFGSAITYLRRYAIQALLGIAAEEDDDGNAASGNRAEFKPRPAPERLPAREGSLIGTAGAGANEYDFELRQSPEGPMIGFKLTQGRQQVRILAYGPLADQIATFREAIDGKTVTCWGTMTNETWVVNKGKPDERAIPYTRLLCSRITGADGFELPLRDEAALREPTEAEEDELDAALAAVK